MKKKIKYKLYGAILGDLCGQPYEFPIMNGNYTNVNVHNPDSEITDDTIMTLATAYAIMHNTTFEFSYKKFGALYLYKGYGSRFEEWILRPYGELNDSFGNGCLMRFSPIMYTSKTPLEIDFLIGASCHNSHAHIDSYETAIALKDLYLNDLDCVECPINEIKPFKKFEVKAVPTYGFIENMFYNMKKYGMSTQECIVKAVECGGDTDTNASIIGELSNFHNNDLTDEDISYVESKLDPFLLDILKSFNERY